MQISEYSFLRLYQDHEAQLTRELEYRRIAQERMREEATHAAPRVNAFQRVAGLLLRGGRSSLRAAQQNRLHSSQ